MKKCLSKCRSSPPTTLGEGACSVIWKDTLIIFGGMTALTVVQQFNFTSGFWKNLAPMGTSHYYFGCGILPKNKNEVYFFLIFNSFQRHFGIQAILT